MVQKRFGFAVFNHDQIMQKFKKFKMDWMTKLDNSTTPVYFVTMDIEKCYDNVNVDQLVHFLKHSTDSLLHEIYQVLDCFFVQKSPQTNKLLKRS